MRLAYADPPYPGQAKRHYAGHPDYAGEVDHAALIRDLEAYDGWALSTSASALQDVLELCPHAEPSRKNVGRKLTGTGVRVGIWHVTNAEHPGNRGTWWWSWEPVIVRSARQPAETVRDVLAFPSPKGIGGNTITGQKPAAFCEWVFRLMGADPDDALVDIFAGSGAVGRAWEAWTRQLALPLAAPLDERRAEHLGSAL